MDLDQEVCLCFHVSLRKLLRHVRVERPQRASQLSDCFGAGTGCGWCRPFLENIFSAGIAQRTDELLPQAIHYTALRERYLEERRSTSPPDSGP